MKQIKELITILLPGLFALFISGNAAACYPTDPGCPAGSTAESWDFANGSYTGNGAWWASGLTFSGSNGTSVTATGWSNSNDANDAYASSYGTGNLVQRDINRYDGSGLGVQSPEDGDYPDHSTDNQHRIDSILLNFGGTAVSMSQLQFGWVYNDNDFTVAAYTGSGTPDLSSMGYSDLTGDGWTIVGSYLGNGPQYDVDVNDGEISSSYWLISALNPYLGGPDGPGDRGYYNNDYFKLGGADGCELPGPPPSTVPEPSTLLLLGCVMLVSLVRSRAQQKRESGCTLQA
jgi:hypothetical protein